MQSRDERKWRSFFLKAAYVITACLAIYLVGLLWFIMFGEIRADYFLRLFRPVIDGL